jgi:hypothetical protein
MSPINFTSSFKEWSPAEMRSFLAPKARGISPFTIKIALVSDIILSQFDNSSADPFLIDLYFSKNSCME